MNFATLEPTNSVPQKTRKHLKSQKSCAKDCFVFLIKVYSNVAFFFFLKKFVDQVMASLINMIFALIVIMKMVYSAPNWFCNETLWHKVSGNWIWQDECSLLLADQTGGAIIWLGNQNWTNYNISILMQLADPSAPTDNAGILFRAKSVSSTNNGGQVSLGFILMNNK